MNPKPLGLVLLGVLAALLGAVLLIVLAALSGDSEPRMIAGRAGVAVLAAVSLVAAEALIRVRPWFYRASFWLVTTFCALIVVLCVVLAGPMGVVVALGMNVLLLAFLVPILVYVRDEARSLGALPARRRPAPRRPVPGPLP